ncbi:hypothetical protein GLOTRDRAFT_97353, partial [Gloeophyllum trabeum ATCC 11539]
HAPGAPPHDSTKFPRTYGYGNVWPTEAKVKSTVISSFLSSPKSDRVGAIFNGQNPVSWAHEEISTCTERGYPIFVYWGSVQAFGKIDPRNVPPYLAPFLPSAGSVNAILAGQSVPSSLPECQPSPPQVHSSWSSWPVLQSSPAQSSSAQSAPAQSSTAQSAPERRYDPLGRGSYIGEGPLEFIERRKARVAERYAKATRSQVQSWNSKAQAQRDYPCPGNSSKAPMVYRWEVLDEERGLLVRCVITRSEVPDIWFGVHDKYKWYDPTENSWDLYDAIRPDRVTVEAYDEPGIDEEYYEPTPPAGSPPTDPVPPPPPTATPPPVPPPPATAAPHPVSPPAAKLAVSASATGSVPPHALGNAIGSEFPPQEDLEAEVVYSMAAEVSWETIDSYPTYSCLRHRYGFMGESDGLDMRRACEDRDFMVFTRSLTIAPSAEEQYPTRYMTEAVSLLRALEDLQESDTNLPEEFGPGSLRNTLFSACIQRRNRNPQESWYLTWTSDGPLCIQGASNARHILRLYNDPEEHTSEGEPPDPLTLALKTGMVFARPIKMWKLALPDRPRHLEPMMRLMDHKFTSVDYKCYVRRRDQFMRSFPHARSALRQGGILWRIAIDSLGLALAEDKVRHSLSQTVPKTGHGVSFVAAINENEVWYEDALSPEEEAYLIGTYFIPVRNGTMAESSWWPKPNTFASSPYHFAGHWTTGAEIWYQDRLVDIRNGTAMPLTQAAWGKDLRNFLPRARRVARGLETASSV